MNIDIKDTLDKGKKELEKIGLFLKKKNKKFAKTLGGTRLLGRDVGKPGTKLENRSKIQLYNLATELQLPGRSKMNKQELIESIREYKS